MSASSELAEYLEDEVAALILGTTLFVDKQPAGAVNSARIVQYPGGTPEHRMDGTNLVQFTFPNLQIRVRNEVDATAFTIAGGAPTVADSPTPFAPMGWCGDGVTVSPVSHAGVSHAVGSK